MCPTVFAVQVGCLTGFAKQSVNAKVEPLLHYFTDKITLTAVQILGIPADNPALKTFLVVDSLQQGMLSG
jgi:hypothetical protein